MTIHFMSKQATVIMSIVNAGIENGDVTLRITKRGITCKVGKFILFRNVAPADLDQAFKAGLERMEAATPSYRKKA